MTEHPNDMERRPFAGPPRPFVKMNGLGNHFVIVDARRDPYTPAAEEIARVCDLHVGVGADQLVVIEPSERADAFMRLYNVDGREVGACGNATRCVAWMLLEESGGDDVTLETLPGVLVCERAGAMEVTCDMGVLRTGWRDIPLARETSTAELDLGAPRLGAGRAVNIGNPQVVFFVPRLDDIDLVAELPVIQANPLFPEGVNVGVAERTGPDALRLAVFERGAGLTRACGSGACAAAFAAIERGLVEPGPVVVDLPGGRMRIELAGGRAVMTGPVAYAFRGEF